MVFLWQILAWIIQILGCHCDLIRCKVEWVFYFSILVNLLFCVCENVVHHSPKLLKSRTLHCRSWQLISEFGNFEHSLDRSKLSFKIFQHRGLLFDNFFLNLVFSLRHLLKLHVLSRDLLQLFFSFFMNLHLFRPVELLGNCSLLFQLLYYLVLLFDLICVLLGQIEIHGGHVLYHLTLSHHLQFLFLQLFDELEKLPYRFISHNFRLFEQRKLQIAPIKLKRSIQNRICNIHCFICCPIFGFQIFRRSLFEFVFDPGQF